jgi:hypothetical protein
MINLYSPSDNRLAIQTTLDNQALGTYGADGENRLALQPLVGRVGIGTTEPAYKLHVAGTAFVSGGLFAQGNTGSVYGASPSIHANVDNHGGGGILVADDGGFFDYNDMYVTYNGSTGLRIAGNNGAASSGNLMVNSLAGAGNRSVYADASGILRAGSGNDNTTWTMSANFSHSPDDWCAGCSNVGIQGGATNYTADDATSTITMPFSVTINGIAYNTVSACTNGWIAFGSTTIASFSNTALPTSSITSTPIIFPYWDDLQDYGTGEYLRWGSVGSSPNQVFIIDYSMRLRSGADADRVNFQVQIHEGSGLINVKYRDSMAPTMNGQGATIGFQLDGGSSAKAYPIVYNGKVLDDNRDDSEGWSVSPVR